MVGVLLADHTRIQRLGVCARLCATADLREYRRAGEADSGRFPGRRVRAVLPRGYICDALHIGQAFPTFSHWTAHEFGCWLSSAKANVQAHPARLVDVHVANCSLWCCSVD